ncbi:MAG: HK97 gp10 family phage protein, partial [Firmicutes bacterium]|nr:HK97 gp10 family phage protein [Bacillota bacterium]
ANAPKRHGDYAKSWSTKKTRQTSRSFEVTVYSRNRYQLAHLLEHGHAKRNGGRTRAQVHIAPAEQNGIRQLEEDIKRSIRNG